MKWTCNGNVEDICGEGHIQGVDIYLTTQNANPLTDWKPVKERIITAYFQTSPVKVTMIQAHDPTIGDDNNNKDGF